VGYVSVRQIPSAKNIKLNTLTVLDRLSLVGSSGRGALEFRPDQSVLSKDEIVNFDHLAAETAKFYKVITIRVTPLKVYTGMAVLQRSAT